MVRQVWGLLRKKSTYIIFKPGNWMQHFLIDFTSLASHRNDICLLDMRYRANFLQITFLIE